MLSTGNHQFVPIRRNGQITVHRLQSGPECLPSALNRKRFEKFRRSTQLPVAPVKPLRKYFRIDRKQIAYLKFILEGYDGMAVLSTLDPEAGVVMLDIGPGCEADVNLIIDDLGREIRIEPLNGPPSDGNLS